MERSENGVVAEWVKEKVREMESSGSTATHCDICGAVMRPYARWTSDDVEDEHDVIGSNDIESKRGSRLLNGTAKKTRSNNSNGNNNNKPKTQFWMELWCECRLLEHERGELSLERGTTRVIERGRPNRTRDRLAGHIANNTPLQRAFWHNVYNAFSTDPAQVNAMYSLSSARELHIAMASIGELFVLTGSLTAGFALQLLTVVDLNTLKEAWLLPLLIFVSLSFIAGIGSVISAAMLFLGVQVTPLSHLSVLVAHFGAWVLRPGQFLIFSFTWLVVAFGILAGRTNWRDVRIVCGTLIAVFSVIVFLICIVLVEKVTCVRNFVHDDIRTTLKRHKRHTKQAKLALSATTARQTTSVAALDGADAAAHRDAIHAQEHEASLRPPDAKKE